MFTTAIHACALMQKDDIFLRLISWFQFHKHERLWYNKYQNVEILVFINLSLYVNFQHLENYCSRNVIFPDLRILVLAQNLYT